MITTNQPQDWRDLQTAVAQILEECGMQTEVEKTVKLSRDSTEVDVVAVESTNGRKSIVFCECKLWQRSIPKNVIHGFRTVVSDGGANVGYVITSSDFQRGAYAAADLTNLKLVTWAEFQDEFEETWIEKHLRLAITSRLDEFMELVAPLLPAEYDLLGDRDKAKFKELHEKYSSLGAIAMMFTTYFKAITVDLPVLPLRDRCTGKDLGLPDALLDATAYRDFMEILIPYGEQAAAELKAALHPEL